MSWRLLIMKELFNQFWVNLVEEGISETAQTKILILLEQLNIKNLTQDETLALKNLLVPFVVDKSVNAEVKELAKEYLKLLNYKKPVEWDKTLDIFNSEQELAINGKPVTVEDLEKRRMEYIDLPILRPNKDVIVERYKVRIHHDGETERIVEYSVQSKEKENRLFNDFFQIIHNNEL